MKSKIVKNYLYNVIMIFLTVIYPIIIFPYVSRILTPYYYGKYSFSISISFYFITFATLGVPTYGIREISKLKSESSESYKKCVSEIVFISIISSFVSYIIYILLISNISILKKDFKLFFILGFQILFSFMTLDYFYIAMERHKRRTIRLVFIKIASLIFLFVYVKKPQDYINYALIMLIPELIAKIIDFYDIKKYLIYDIKKLNFKKHIKALIIIFFYILSTTIYLNIDSTMLGIFKGDIEVGYYSVSVKMTKIIIPLITSLGLVLAPRMIESIKNNDEVNLFKNMDLYLNFIYFSSIPIIILLYFFASDIIKIFSGKEYLAATLPMQIMLPVILFISLSGFSAANFLIPKGDEKKVLEISLIGLVINFILNFILIPRYSIVGAAVATLVAEFVVAVLRFLGVKKYCFNYKMFNKERVTYILAGFFSLLVLVFASYYKMEFNEYVTIFIKSALYIIIYFIVLYLRKEYFINIVVKFIKEKIKYKN